MSRVTPLASGAEVRITNPGQERAVVLVNGGTRSAAPGTWSATLEWLVRRLAPRFPRLAFLEVRYRVKSWQRLDLCVEDARAALARAVADGGRACALLGFSMGGAVAIGAAEDPAVSTVVGLAPWIPERLEVGPLEGRRLAVLHGVYDRALPGIPGVSPANSRRGFERALALGVEASYMLIPGAVHGVAVRAPGGGLIPLPRAARWVRLVSDELERFQADA